MTDVVPVYLVEYVNPSEIEEEFGPNGEPRVVNHDDIEKQAVIRGMNRDSAEKWNMDIVEEGDTHWEPGFASMEIGDEVQVGEPYV